jgi:hypothetical protein
LLSCLHNPNSQEPPLHPSLSQVNCVHIPTTCLFTFILILSSYVCKGLPTDLFPSGFPITIRPTYGFLIHSMPATCLANTSLIYPGFEVLTLVTIMRKVFWVSALCSSQRTRRFVGIDRFHLQNRRMSQARNRDKRAYSSTLKMKATCSSGNSGSLRTTRRYTLEERLLQSAIITQFFWTHEEYHSSAPSGYLVN